MIMMMELLVQVCVLTIWTRASLFMDRLADDGDDDEERVYKYSLRFYYVSLQ